MIALLLLAQLAVTDGDTLKAPWGERYRLHGIDAPELAQECERDGEAYACGLEAKAALEALLEGKETVCEPIEQGPLRQDRGTLHGGRHGRGREMVRQGWALDYPRYSSYEYARAQQYAKDRRLGMWAGEFTEPWEWRRVNR